MAAVATIAALVDIVKRKYVQRDLSNQALIRSPFWNSVKRIDDLTGEGIYVPYNYGLPPNGSASYSIANANIKASKVAKWFLERKEYHAAHTIKAEAIYASRGKEAAFLSIKEKEISETLKYMQQEFAVHAWGDGSGVIGRITADPGAGNSVTMTLHDSRDANKLHIGQTLGAASAATAGTERGDTYLITAVDRVAGTFTATQVGSADDWAIDDYIFVAGNYDAMMTGVQGFIPAANPGVGAVPSSLFGMTRTDDPVMKAGWRGTWEGSIEESALSLCSNMGAYFNDAASALWLSRRNWYRLERELEAKNRKIVDTRASDYFGVTALSLLTPEGEVPVMADPFCPAASGFLLDHSSWEVHHMEGLPHVVMDDGLAVNRIGSDDSGIKVQFRAWLQGLCFRPFTNGRFDIE